MGAASGTLTVGKLLVASNGFVVANAPGGLTINASGDVIVEPTGQITVAGQGAQFGSGSGTGIAVGNGTYYCGGGGHGGFGGAGGNMNARGGFTFDSTSSPTTSGGSGAGSGSSFSPFGGRGGGTIRMTVSGNLIVNGAISADGKVGSGSYAGGGAGGSVWLTLITWSGSGIISANGGPGVLPGGGGGGGGRISISYNSNLFSGLITAYGGAGTNVGGAGSIYLKTNFQGIAQITVDNGGNAGTNSTIDTGPTFDLTILGKAVLQLANNWTARNIRVGTDSTLTAGTLSQQNMLVSANDVTVDAGGAITMDGLGYTAGQGTGAGSQNSSPRGGGGHGGMGGNNPSIGSFGSVYGSITSPITFGSGGGSSGGTGTPPLGGAGGGYVNLNLSGKLTVNGRLSSNGRNGDTESGGGAGGSVRINCVSLFGSGVISANGGNGAGNAGGGGGGRVAITYTSNNFSNSFAGIISAFGGTGLVGGGAGTVYSKPLSANVTTLIVDNGGLSGASTPLSAGLGAPSSPYDLTVNGGAVASLLTALSSLNNVTVGASGTISIPSNQLNLTITVLKNVSVASGGSINVDGKGFGRAAGPGPGSSIASKGAGGGYGAIGGASASGAPGGTNYGSVTQPVDRGSGGGAGANTFFGGSDGGGAIRLTVAGTLNVDGSLTANGNAGLQDDSGGGAGGSIWVTADVMSGGGIISANGGAGELFGGGGGAGGRIAIYSRVNTFAGTFAESGGTGANAGGNGTLFLAGLPTIQGTITDTNGQPVPGVSVSASIGNASATTGVDGKYEINPGVVLNSFTVTPSFSGLLFVPGSRNYSVLPVSVTNQDYLAVTSITPTLTSTSQGTNLSLSWFGISGVTYQIYSSTNLFDWQPYNDPMVGSNVVMNVVVPIGSGPKNFFRVRANN
jgi:hypothetical protein